MVQRSNRWWPSYIRQQDSKDFREIMFKRSVDGRENIKITIKSSWLGEQVKTPTREQKGDGIVVQGIKQQQNKKSA